MRQVRPATNLVLACIAAVCLVTAMDLPWFAPALEVDPDSTAGPVERAAMQLAAVFASAEGTMTVADVFPEARTLVLVLASAIVGLAAAMAVPALRPLIREPLRAVGLGAVPVVAYMLLAAPGVPDGHVVHWGALVALAVSALLASAAWHGSAMRTRRPAPGGWARAGS